MIHLSELIVEIDGVTICRPPPFDVAAGQRLQLVGPNGCGKTTLLRVMAGLMKATRGVCRIEAPQRQRVYVHQSPLLFRGGVNHNLAYGMAAAGVPRGDRTTIARQWLERLGAARLIGRSSRGLSGGERRRVALARAFALRPKLLLLDEPFSDLDSEGESLVMEALNELPESTIVIATPTAANDIYEQVDLRRDNAGS